jgi:hypothetical protein
MINTFGFWCMANADNGLETTAAPAVNFKLC